VDTLDTPAVVDTPAAALAADTEKAAVLAVAPLAPPDRRTHFAGNASAPRNRRCACTTWPEPLCMNRRCRTNPLRNRLC